MFCRNRLTLYCNICFQITDFLQKIKFEFGNKAIFFIKFKIFFQKKFELFFWFNVKALQTNNQKKEEKIKILNLLFGFNKFPNYSVVMLEKRQNFWMISTLNLRFNCDNGKIFIKDLLMSKQITFFSYSMNNW